MDFKSLLLLSLTGYASFVFKDLPKMLLQNIVKRFTTSVSVLSSNKDVYKNVNNWIYKLDKSILNNNLHFKQIYNNFSDEREVVKTLNYGTYTFWHKKNLINITKSEIANTFDVYDKITITFGGFDRRELQKNIFEKIQKNKDEKNIVLRNLRDSEMKITKRNISSVFFEQKSNLIEHIKKWKNNKSFYEENGMPYKTGILLYGEAGTGKSSLSRALATYLDYDIHLINLKIYNEPKEILSLISCIKPKSIVLFEDIDCLFNTNRNKSDDDFLFNIVLNFIDGLLSPSEVIFMATTNHIEKLDDALIREGRFDLKIPMGKIGKESAFEMCNFYNVTTDILKYEDFPINPSYLQSKILKNIEK